MPDVAGGALRAAVQPPVRDEAGPDAGTDLDVEHVALAAAEARPQLPERHDVHVVVDPGGHGVAGGEPVAHRVRVPARHDRRRDRAAAGELDRAGEPDAHPPQRRRRLRPGRQQLVEQLLDPAQDRLRAGRHVQRLLPQPQQRAAEVGDTGLQVGRPQLGDQQAAGAGAEAQLTGRPPARGGREPAVLEQPGVEQLLHPLADDVAPQPELPHQLRTGAQPSGPHSGEDQRERLDLVGSSASTAVMRPPRSPRPAAA